MEKPTTETRIVLAAYIYGIEMDLKNVINKHVTPFHSDLGFLQDARLQSTVIERFNKENPGIDYKKNLEDVVDFLDFQDTFVTLKKNEIFLPKTASDYLKTIYDELTEITPIRNRVMHTRPLLGGDFSKVFDFVQNLRANSPISWKVTIETRENLAKDPCFIQTLHLPDFSFNNENSPVIHNLPIPDFDDTGFIGRINDLEEIKKLIVSNKVVSILGDGGIGKTALAVKVAYDFVDMGEKCPFELIIWTSAKTTMLTAKGIEEIYSAITDYTGLISVISENIDKSIVKNKLEQILEYLELFKTLIIIDNLETIQSEEVRNFIREAQTKCHIVITSRIGLGELEYPRPLRGLSEKECEKLIRATARVRNSDILLKLDPKTLSNIASKLYYNPLALKWFVSTVETGVTPLEVLNNKDDLLNFCLTNVYEKLSSGAISILNTIRSARRKLTNAEILYLSDYDTIEAKKYLTELYKTTLLCREVTNNATIENVYFCIPEFAKDFLSRKYPVDQDFVKRITKKSKELTSGIQEIKKISSYNEFNVFALDCENQNQKIAAKLLTEALGLSRKKEYEKAYDKVSDAKNVDPNYYEVYRISAFIKASNGDTLSAEEDYKTALELAPDNPRLLYFYAQFLLFIFEDTENALYYAQKLNELRPNHPCPVFLYARCYNMTKDYGKAINIIKKLIENQSGLDPLNYKTAHTELISLYGNSGYTYLKVQNDINNGINHFKKSFEVFEKCRNESCIDKKMIKNFCDSLFSFLCILPPTEIAKTKEYICELIERNISSIVMFSENHRVITKYSEKFEDKRFNEQIDLAGKEGLLIGNIVKNPTMDTFVFIEAEEERYYAHKKSFTDIKTIQEFKAIKNGQFVKFELGSNDKGVCAKNVRLISEI